MQNSLDFVWVVSLILMIILAVRLVTTGLARRYRAFFVWVCWIGCRLCVVEILATNTARQFYFWLYTEPITILAYVLAVFEIYTLALQPFQGLKTFSKRLLTFALIIASVISVLSVLPDIQFHKELADRTYLLTGVIRRGIYTSLLAFLVLLVSFISFFPVRLNRNTIVHVMLFSLLFLFYSIGILMLNVLGRDVVQMVNSVGGVLALFVFGAWIALLKPSGEHVQSTVRPKMSSEDAEELLAKLRALNDSISSSR